jgi:hypothetical protein
MSFVLFVIASIAGSVIAWVGSPVLAKVLLAYGLAARIPVLVVMLLAMLGNWGTHYDAVAPNFPAMSLAMRWFMTGVVPQLTVWIAFTIVLGCLIGGLTLAIARPKPALQTA